MRTWAAHRHSVERKETEDTQSTVVLTLGSSLSVSSLCIISSSLKLGLIFSHSIITEKWKLNPGSLVTFSNFATIKRRSSSFTKSTLTKFYSSSFPSGLRVWVSSWSSFEAHANGVTRPPYFPSTQYYSSPPATYTRLIHTLHLHPISISRFFSTVSPFITWLLCIWTPHLQTHPPSNLLHHLLTSPPLGLESPLSSTRHSQYWLSRHLQTPSQTHLHSHYCISLPCLILWCLGTLLVFNCFDMCL